MRSWGGVELTTVVFFRARDPWLASLLLSTVHVCFIHNVQRFLIALSGRNKEKYIYSIFPEAEIRKLITSRKKGPKKKKITTRKGD